MLLCAVVWVRLSLLRWSQLGANAHLQFSFPIFCPNSWSRSASVHLCARSDAHIHTAHARTPLAYLCMHVFFVFKPCTSARFCVYVRQIRILLLVRYVETAHLNYFEFACYVSTKIDPKDRCSECALLGRPCSSYGTLGSVDAFSHHFPFVQLHCFALLCACTKGFAYSVVSLRSSLPEAGGEIVMLLASFVCIIIRLWKYNMRVIYCILYNIM